MRGAPWEVDRTPSWFIIVSVNYHSRVLPLPAREGRGWALELPPAASLWAPPSTCSHAASGEVKPPGQVSPSPGHKPPVLALGEGDT